MQQWSISRDIDDLEQGVLALDDEPKANDAQEENLSTPIQDAENHTPASMSPQLNPTASVQPISSGFEDEGQWMLTVSQVGGLSSDEPAIQRKRRRIWVAESDGDFMHIQPVLPHGITINSTEADAGANLLAAARDGRVDLATILLDQGANVNFTAPSGDTPVSMAARNGHYGVTRLLLQRGANVDGSGRDSCVPLIAAAEMGHSEIAILLLDHGATLESDTAVAKSLLVSAAKYGDTDLVQNLLQRDININCVAREGDSTDRGLHSFMLKSAEYRSLLPAAIKGGHLKTVQLLLECGAEPNGHEFDFYSPLAIAINGGHNEIALQLLERKANPNTFRPRNDTPLKAAVERGDYELVRRLLQCGADPNQESPNNTTCEWDFYPGWRTKDLQSPLSVAAKGGNIEIIQLLLEYGANPNGHEHDSDSPLDDSIVIAIKQKESKRAYQRLHEVFLKEHLRFFTSSRENSASSSFLAIGNKLEDHRKMWKRGIHTLRQILSNDTPQTLEEAVSFLHIVSAMRLFIHGAEMIGSKDEFLEDLDRWKVIVADEERSLYDEIMFAMWGKEPNNPLAGDSVYTIEAQLEYFQKLASSLIAQTGVTQLSGAPSGHGLHRLRAVHSGYESFQNPPSSYPKHQRADQSAIGEERLLLVQDDHRFIEMYGGEQILAEPTPPPSRLVVFLMAGAIFGIVITFLLSEQVLNFLLYFTNLNVVSRNFSRDSSLRCSIRDRQTKILNHIIDSVILPLSSASELYVPRNPSPSLRTNHRSFEARADPHLQRVGDGVTGGRSGRMSQCIRGIKTRSLTKGYRHLSARINICILFKSVQICASEIAGSGWQGWLFVIVASIWLCTLVSLDKGPMKTTSHPMILGMGMAMNAGKKIPLQMCQLVRSKHHLLFILKRKGRIQAFQGKGTALVKERN